MFVYKDGHIDHVITSEGRMKRNQDGSYYPEYFLKDHLGNVRMIHSPSSGLSQATDYYPFGLEIPVYGVNDNQIKYNSKELQTDAKLNWYDYGARFYDPVIGRLHVVDPMAEKCFSFSPYEYVGGNPILRIDPDGMDWDVTKDENRNIHFNVTVQVKNTAGIPQEQLEGLMNSIKSSFESIFQGTSEDGATYSSTLNIDWNGEDVASSDFFVDFVTVVQDSDGKNIENALGKVDEIGNTNSNRIQIKVGGEFDQVGRTGSHEMGHSGGEHHPDLQKPQDLWGHPLQSDNIIYPSDNSTRGTITPYQLNRIYKTVINGYSKPPQSIQKMPIKKIDKIE
jgi:RHS repeat-associated protein